MKILMCDRTAKFYWKEKSMLQTITYRVSVVDREEIKTYKLFATLNHKTLLIMLFRFSRWDFLASVLMDFTGEKPCLHQMTRITAKIARAVYLGQLTAHTSNTSYLFTDSTVRCAANNMFSQFKICLNKLCGK